MADLWTDRSLMSIFTFYATKILVFAVSQLVLAARKPEQAKQRWCAFCVFLTQLTVPAFWPPNITSFEVYH